MITPTAITVLMAEQNDELLSEPKVKPRMTRPTGDPISDAFIAGFLDGVDRQRWDDMHDFAAMKGLTYAKVLREGWGGNG